MHTHQGTTVVPYFFKNVVIIPLLLGYAVFGQMRSEANVLLGVVKNHTISTDYDGIATSLYRELSSLPQFPPTILDTTLLIDSFPDDTSLLSARTQNIAYIIWGVIDSCEPGPGITIHILDIAQGTVSHIRLSIDRHDGGRAVAETVRSKLQLWLQRTTMVQLIITTHPAEASVLLDDTLLGATPLETMLQPGTYHLELTKKGVLPVSIPVSFISGNTYQYDITLGTAEERIDKRPIFRLLGLSVACLGAGGGAHWQRLLARERYRKATPPSDFDGLYHRTVAWEVGRDVLFTASGAALGLMALQVVLK